MVADRVVSVPPASMVHDSISIPLDAAPVRPVPFTVERELWAARLAFVGVIEENVRPTEDEVIEVYVPSARPWGRLGKGARRFV